MSEFLPDPIIVRTCPEHRVRIYEQYLKEITQSGFRLDIQVTPMKTPRRDYMGRLLVANVNHFWLDDRYPPKHKRHIVLHTHSFRTAEDQIGASGKLDPKEILIGDKEYRQLEFESPRCDLCVGGDMIPLAERFESSHYRPDVSSKEPE